MKKILLFAIAAVALVACDKNKQDEPDQPVDLKIAVTDADYMAQGMSANHKYAVGQTVGLKPFYWDVEAGDVKELSVSGALYAVNNQGVAVGCEGEGEQFAVRYEGGKSTKLAAPEGAYGSAAWDITEDGSMMVGFYYDATYATKPCYWLASGEIHDLPVPTEDEVGFALSGAAVRWVSADGSVILGYLLDDFSTWPAAVWNRQADGSYVCDPICKDYFEPDYQMGKPYMTFGYGTSCMSLSDNGEWIALTVQDEYDPWNWDVEPAPYKAARMNLKTKQLEVLADVPTLTGIANDGTAIGYDGESPTMRTAYAWKAGESKAISFSDKFDHDDLAGVGSCSPMAIAADGKAVCGFAVKGDLLFSFVLY